MNFKNKLNWKLKQNYNNTSDKKKSKKENNNKK